LGYVCLTILTERENRLGYVRLGYFCLTERDCAVEVFLIVFSKTSFLATLGVIVDGTVEG
jgi:hypothetical protein